MSAELEPRHVAASFGEIVVAERRRRNLTQEALAVLSDLHRSHISLLERGGRMPTLSTIAHLAGALGIPPATFVDDLGIEWFPAGLKGSGYGAAGFFRASAPASGKEDEL